MDILELKEKFKELVEILGTAKMDHRIVVDCCLMLFQKGAYLYDRLPEIEQCLASFPSTTSADVVKKFNIIQCILSVGRTEVYRASNFIPANLAAQGEETTTKTICFAWVNLHDIEVDTPSNVAIKNVLRDKICQIYDDFVQPYQVLEQLSKRKV